MKAIEIRYLDNDNGSPIRVLAKCIRIEDLPDCFYKERLFDMVDDTKRTLWVVGKPGKNEDWSAYIGHPDISAWKPEHVEDMLSYMMSRLHRPEGTMSNGDKLPKAAARALFPEFAERKYRR